MVNSKLSKCIEIINKVKHKLKVSSLKLMYHTFFECHFNDSINLWRNIFPSNISKIVTLQKRIICNIFYTNHKAFYKYKILKLQDLIKKLSIYF